MTNDSDSNNPSHDADQHSGSQTELSAAAPEQRTVGKQGKESTDKNQTTTEEMRREFRWFEFGSLFINGALALIGVAALCIYNGQLGVMRGQLGEIIRQYPELQKSAQAAQDGATVSKEALYAVQRAFITFPPSPTITLFNLPNEQRFMVDIAIDNAGATPAHKLRDRVSWIAPIGPLPFGTYKFPDRSGKYGTPWAANGANVIAAKGEVVSQSVQIDNAVIQEFRQQNGGPWPQRFGKPTHPTRNIVFYGWAIYRDIFDKTPVHLSEFCRELTALIIEPQRTPQAAWGYCPSHNCSDEDCPDYKERIQAIDAVPTYHQPEEFKKRE
jgi:hypothetical protein